MSIPVKIVPQVDAQKPKKEFDKFKKQLSKPIKTEIRLKDVGGLVGKIGKALDKVSLKGLHREFDKMDKRATGIADKLVGKAGKGITRAGAYGIEAYKQSELKQSFDTGMGSGSQYMSQLGQHTGGGFSSAIQNQLKFVKSVKDGAVNMYQSWKSWRAERQQANQNPAQGSIPQPNQPGGSGSPTFGGAVRGGLLNAVGSGVMVLEGISKAAGFLIQTASTMGEKHIQSMMSQAGTIGSTGGYIGGGGGYFDNAQIAQGQVGYNRALGRFGNQAISREQDFGSMKRYAAEQNMGFAQFADAVGEFRRVAPGIRVAMIKGASEQANITGLKQGEFITQISQQIKQARMQGYGNVDLMNTLGLTAGIGQGLTRAGMPTDRAATIAGQLNTQARQAEKGGIFGQLALAQKLGEGKDYFQSVKELEKEGLTQQGLKSIQDVSGSKEIMGTLARMQGLTQREGEALYGTSVQSIGESQTGYKAYGNQGLAMQNKSNEAFATNRGAIAGAKLAEDMQMRQLDMMNRFSGQIESFANAVGRIEEGVFNTVSKSAPLLEKGVNSITEMGNKLGDMIQALNRLIAKLS